MSEKNTSIDRRIIKSKAALKESIIQLIKEKEFNEITVTDIVHRAELNRGTFYRHYQLKEELLEDVIAEVIEDLIVSYREPYVNVETFVLKELKASTIKIFDHVVRYKAFYTLIVKSNVLIGLQNRICNELKKLVLQDLHDQELNSKINRELFASYQSYAILGLIKEWVDAGFKYNSDYMAEQLLEIIRNNYMNND